MNILITLFRMQNYGGISNYTEELKKGFNSLNHNCDLILLSSTDRKVHKTRHSKRPGVWNSVFQGMTVSSDTGWGGVDVHSIGNLDRIKEFRCLANTYDLVIWMVPVPSYAFLNEVPKWKSIYKLKIPQIAVIHDGNFRTLYPHLNLISEKLNGVACVHETAFNSAKLLNGRYSLIPNPHPYLKIKKSWEEKHKTIVCAHIWKFWKHMEYAVSSVPHLEKSNMIIGGDGIERCYMTSLNKRKPKYGTIWEEMEDSGKAKYVGLLTTEELFKHYSNSRVMLDPSFSKNYNLMGSHFNRSVIEAYNHGMVPVCMEENMGFSLFSPNETYIPINSNMSPKEVAEVLDYAANLSSKKSKIIIENGREILKKHFRRSKVAQDLIDLSKSKKCGIFNNIETGSPNKNIENSIDRVLSGKQPFRQVL